MGDTLFIGDALQREFLALFSADLAVTDAEQAAIDSFFDKLAFWRKDDPESKPQYRIFVAEAAGASDVMVQGADGKPDNSSTSKRILSLLLEQLK